MPSRQRNLLLGLAAAVLLWQGGVWGNHLVLEPLRQLRNDVAKKTEAVATKRDQALAVDLAQGKLRAWQTRSLPPDPGKKARPDAIEAHRQYTAWLTELVHAVGFDGVTVTPQRKSVSRNNVYVEVVVQIEGEGRFSQLVELLDRFYRTSLLQRIGRIQISSEDVFGDPPVKFLLEAQALALADAPVRRTMFPQTTLAAELDAEAEQLRVASATGFPKKTPFRIRLERELLDVTNVAGETWTVKRGAERTERQSHPAKTTLHLNPIENSTAEMAPEDFREFVRTNVFVKPSPPVNYEPTFGPFSPPVVVRGKSWQFSVAAKDYDPARGEPKYRLQGELQDGLELNENTGQLTWKPDVKLPAGDYPLTVEARHPSAPEGRLVEELTLKLVEPNSPPKFSPIAGQTVYRGQPWKLTLEALDADMPKQKLTYKLGADSPPDCRIDADTGELTWTPGEAQPIGPVSVAVSVTDQGVPPQTAGTSIAVTVKEDTASQTLLYGIVGEGDERQALFFDKSLNRKTMLRIGEELQAADIQATIAEISPLFITVQRGESQYRMKLGETVRSLAKAMPLIPADSAETPR